MWQGEWWRLFTGMFLHIGPVHLLWNLYAGWSWCAPLERRIGTLRYLPLYLGSGVVASAFSVIGHDVVAAGASGAMFGIIGALLALDRLELGSWKALQAKQSRNLTMIALWLAIGPFAGFDNWAHAGGLVAGAAFGWLLHDPQRGAARLAAASMLLVVAFSLVPRWDLQVGSHAAMQVDRVTKAEHWEEALAVLDRFEQGPEFEKHEAWAGWERLRAWKALGDVDAGVAWSERQLALGATADRHVLCAMALEQAGDADAGLGHVEEALRLDPQHAAALSLRARQRLTRGDSAGGLGDAHAAVLAMPDDANFRLTLAWALGASGDYSTARVELQQAERLGAEARVLDEYRAKIDEATRRPSDAGVP